MIPTLTAAAASHITSFCQFATITRSDFTSTNRASLHVYWSRWCRHHLTYYCDLITDKHPGSLGRLSSTLCFDFSGSNICRTHSGFLFSAVIRSPSVTLMKTLLLWHRRNESESVWSQGGVTLTRHPADPASSSLTRGQSLPFRSLTCRH